MKNFLAYFITTPVTPTLHDLTLLVGTARAGFERNTEQEPTHAFVSVNVSFPAGIETISGLTLVQDTSFRGPRLGVGILVD